MCAYSSGRSAGVLHGARRTIHHDQIMLTWTMYGCLWFYVDASKMSWIQYTAYNSKQRTLYHCSKIHTKEYRAVGLWSTHVMFGRHINKVDDDSTAHIEQQLVVSWWRDASDASLWCLAVIRPIDTRITIIATVQTRPGRAGSLTVQAQPSRGTGLSTPRLPSTVTIVSVI